jgi:hypothetical protein
MENIQTGNTFGHKNRSFEPNGSDGEARKEGAPLEVKRPGNI